MNKAIKSSITDGGPLSIRKYCQGICTDKVITR